MKTIKLIILLILSLAPSGFGQPTVKIDSPAANASVTNNALTVTGRATDKTSTITQVLWGLNGSPITNVAIGTTNWTALVDLTPGNNIFSAQSKDLVGNHSLVFARRLFFLSVPSLLTVAIVGSGSNSPTTFVGSGTPTNGAMLELTRSYTVTAVPGSSYLFSNWLASVDGGPTNVAWSNAVYTFPMQTNLTLIAQFVTNRFIAAAGTYYGLFWDTVNGVSHQSAGFLQGKIDSARKFSGKVYLDGDIFSGSSKKGAIGLDGQVSFDLGRDKKDKSPVKVTLLFDLDSGDNVSGTLSNAGWIATATGGRAVFNLTTNPATNSLGQYTMVIPGTNDPSRGPSGDGYALITVASNGVAKATGLSGDGQALKPAVASVTKDGAWPFFAPLYPYFESVSTPAPHNVKNTLGELMGWLWLTNNNLNGSLVWIKPDGWTNVFYSDGFTNELAVLGSDFSPSDAGQRLIEVTNGAVTLNDGNLSGTISNMIYLNTANKVIVSNNVNTIKLTLNPKSGLMNGTFIHPNNPAAPTKIKGAVLQNLNTGRGFFLGTNQSGSILLEDPNAP